MRCRALTPNIRSGPLAVWQHHCEKGGTTFGSFVLVRYSDQPHKSSADSSGGRAVMPRKLVCKRNCFALVPDSMKHVYSIAFTAHTLVAVRNAAESGWYSITKHLTFAGASSGVSLRGRPQSSILNVIGTVKLAIACGTLFSRLA